VSMIDTACREIGEEVGVEIDPTKVVPLGSIHLTSLETTVHLMCAKYVGVDAVVLDVTELQDQKVLRANELVEDFNRSPESYLVGTELAIYKLGQSIIGGVCAGLGLSDGYRLR
jgi:hypothetical protein